MPGLNLRGDNGDLNQEDFARHLAGFNMQGERAMRKIHTAIVASTILVSPAFAYDHERWHDDDRGHHFHAAPGPIAGASLPVLAVGYVVYWLVRRRRKAGR